MLLVFEKAVNHNVW